MTETLHYAFVAGNPQAAPMLLLHGTGGDEHDLLPLGHFLAPEASLLAIRGRINEQGANRYFKHLPGGGFDLDNLSHETDWLVQTVQSLSAKHDLDLNKLIVMGYSNGANVAAAFIRSGQLPLKTGLFFHPMILGPTPNPADLTGTKIWLSHGNQDPIVSKSNYEALVAGLNEQHAQVTTYSADQSHNLSENELQAAQQWLSESNRL